jgi:hypothetical protein
MRELIDIVTSLLDVDGACRDVTFEGSSWNGVADLIRCLQASYPDCSASAQEVRALTGPLAASLSRAIRDKGCVLIEFRRGPGIIKRLQVFVSGEADGSPFVELTFFPEDVKPTQELRCDFIEWADTMQRHLRARCYYARYENASWQLGDISSTGGVFFVSDELDVDES